eukprot:4363713-Pyramimonas_sp.AAC.1
MDLKPYCPLTDGSVECGVNSSDAEGQKWAKVDNIVEISTPKIGPLPVVTTTATLSHTLQVLGPRTIRIVFEDVT